MKPFVRRSAKTTGTLTPDAIAYLEAHKARFREHMKQAMACRPPHKQGFQKRLDADG